MPMEVALLAPALTEFLAPALPYLLALGGEAAKKASHKLGEDTWAKAKELWAKLRPKVEDEKAAETAVQEVAKEPEEEAYRVFLTNQLEKILAKEPTLAQQVERLLGEAGALHHYQAQVKGSGAVAQGQGAVAAGAGGVAVGRDLQGSVRAGKVDDEGTPGSDES